MRCVFNLSFLFCVISAPSSLIHLFRFVLFCSISTFMHLVVLCLWCVFVVFIFFSFFCIPSPYSPLCSFCCPSVSGATCGLCNPNECLNESNNSEHMLYRRCLYHQIIIYVIQHQLLQATLSQWCHLRVYFQNVRTRTGAHTLTHWIALNTPSSGWLLGTMRDTVERKFPYSVFFLSFLFLLLLVSGC